MMHWSQVVVAETTSVRQSLSTLQVDRGCAQWSVTLFVVSKCLRHLGQVGIGEREEKNGEDSALHVA